MVPSPVARRREVDHLVHRRGIFVPGHDDDARLDLPGVTSLIEEGPNVRVSSSSLGSAVMFIRYI